MSWRISYIWRKLSFCSDYVIYSSSVTCFSESPDEGVITPPVIDLVGISNDFQEKSQEDHCISGPIVLGTMCFLCFVIVAASVIDILLFLAFRKARNKEMDMHNESNSARITRSSEIHEGR